jgi:hypothetical protein
METEVTQQAADTDTPPNSKGPWRSRRFWFAVITFATQLPTLGVALSAAVKTHDPFVVVTTVIGGVVSLGANAALTYFGFQGGAKITLAS